MPAEIGPQHFLIVAKVGSGGFGQVYEYVLRLQTWITIIFSGLLGSMQV